MKLRGSVIGNKRINVVRMRSRTEGDKRGNSCIFVDEVM